MFVSQYQQFETINTKKSSLAHIALLLVSQHYYTVQRYTQNWIVFVFVHEHWIFYRR